jgi:hypothetical protein
MGCRDGPRSDTSGPSPRYGGGGGTGHALPAVGQVRYPHVGHPVAPRLTRAPHMTQGRPLGFVASARRPRIPSTRTRVKGRRHVVLGGIRREEPVPRGPVPGP